MNCHDIEQSLVAYLNNEVGRSERELIRAHIAGCTQCQHELARITALQTRVSNALHTTATPANPSPHAWMRLKAQLTVEPESTLGERMRRTVAYIATGSIGSIVMPRFLVLATTVLVASAAMIVYSWRDGSLPVAMTPASIQASPSTDLRESPVTAPAARNDTPAAPAVLPTAQPILHSAAPIEPRRISGPLDDAFGDTRANYRTSHVSQPSPKTSPAKSKPGQTFGFLTLLLPDDASPYRACPSCTQQQ